MSHHRYKTACQFILFTGLWFFANPAFPQTPTGGMIQGRVLNADNGEYLYKARVIVEPIGVETLTDELGFYRFTQVPSGDIIVKVFYTGLVSKETSLTVSGGRTVGMDFDLRRIGSTAKEGEVITLDAFTVTAKKEEDGASIATNTQRFAPNTMNVVTADEFGFVADGNIGAALKFLPGVDAVYGDSGLPGSITLSGAPSYAVPVTVGGVSLASANALTAQFPGRETDLQQTSLINFSRIEVNKSPTPESPGNSLAGSVNLVPRSAFEFSRPRLEMRAYLSALQNRLTLAETPLPLRGKERQIFPGATFNLIYPVNSRFGFTVSASHSVTPNQNDRINTNWSANYNASTKSYQSPNYNLYFYEAFTYSQLYYRDSGSITADYKISPNDTISVSYTQTHNLYRQGVRRVRWDLTGSFDFANSDATTTRTGKNAQGQPLGTILQGTELRDNQGQNLLASAVYRHRGPMWNAELIAGYSRALNQYSDADKGFFFAVSPQLANVDITMSGINGMQVSSITATRGGVPVSPYDLNSFAPFGFTVSGVQSTLPVLRAKPEYVADYRKQLQGSLQRRFDWRVPVRVKIGAEVVQSVRDTFLPGSTGLRYTGTTANIGQFQLRDYDLALPLGLGIPPTVDNFALLAYYRFHPQEFVPANAAGDYSTTVQFSRYYKETTPAGYVRFDTNFLRNRVGLVFGVRYEQTRMYGEGQLIDPTLNYVRNAAGQVLATDGTVYTRAPGQVISRIDADTLAVAMRTRIPRGGHAQKTYDNYFPSANVTFNITDKFLARASYSQTIGRPNLTSITPSATLPDLFTSPPPNGTITINNTQLKPWKSENYTVAGEYYFPKGGDVTLRAFRRTITGAFGSMSVPDEDKPSYFDLYNIDYELYGGYRVNTSVNIDEPLTTEGLELSARYGLNALLPDWARGFRISVNASHNSVKASPSAQTRFGSDLQRQPYSVGWGVSLSRARFSVSVNAKWNGLRQRSSDTSANASPNTFNYDEPITRVDMEGTFNLTKRYGLFVSGRNINKPQVIQTWRSPTTPDYASNKTRNFIVPYWTAGVKATF